MPRRGTARKDYDIDRRTREIQREIEEAVRADDQDRYLRLYAEKLELSRMSNALK